MQLALNVFKLFLNIKPLYCTHMSKNELEVDRLCISLFWHNYTAAVHMLLLTAQFFGRYMILTIFDFA